MRVLHVVPTYLPATRYGGPIYSVHGLAKGQVGLGHDVDVFTTNVDGPTVSQVRLGQPVDLNGVKVTYFSTDIGRRLYRSSALGRALDSRIAEFDFVHLHSVFLWPTFAAARAAVARQVPYVLSPRGMLVKQLIAHKSKIAKSTWIRLVERRNIEQASAIHVTSALEAEELARFGFKLPELIEIANGIDPPEEYDAAKVSADVQAVVSRDRYILSFGRINWKKNLPELVFAWRGMSKARLIIAGSEEDGAGADLAALVRSEGLSGHVDIINRPVHGADKEHLFDRCAAFIMPSLSENFGNTALEAMVRGKPVIATETIGAAAIIKTADCGIICSPNAASLATAVQRMLADQDELARMGGRGRAVALAQYGWEPIAGEMMAAYQAILDKRL